MNITGNNNLDPKEPTCWHVGIKKNEEIIVDCLNY